MIDHVMTDIVAAMHAELARAQEDHGKHYASMHEAYGVLSEELYEAGIEFREANAYEGMLLSAIHKGNNKLLREELNIIHHRALQAACELVQVAAVAQKAISTVNEKGGLIRS